MLAEQHRMHPAIAAWPAAHFYAGALRDAAEVLGGRRAAAFHALLPPLAFLDCRRAPCGVPCRAPFFHACDACSCP